MEIPLKESHTGDDSKMKIGESDPAMIEETESYQSTEKDADSLGSDINVCISECNLNSLKQKRTCKQAVQDFFGIPRPMTQFEFQEKTMILYKCCLKSVRDLHELHLRRIIGIKVIDEIIARGKNVFMNISQVIHIIWSIMSCMHHFQLRLKTGGLGIIFWARRKKTEHCMNTYLKLIHIFKKDVQRIMLNSIITFYREGRLWEVEFNCTDLIVPLLGLYDSAESGIEDFLMTIETCTLINIQEAKYLTTVLYEILKKIKWRSMSPDLMKKIMSMLESSICPRPIDQFNYFPLRKGLEICVRNIVGNLRKKDLIKFLYLTLKRMAAKSVTEEVTLNFGNVAAYAAKKFRMRSNKTFFDKGPFPLIFGLFRSHNPILNLLAARIWQNLVDRDNNANIFLSPRIFYQDCNYGIRIAKLKQTDKLFFKGVRHVIFDIVVGGFIRATDRMTMENTFQAIALTLTEIPCGYTASCFVTVAMTLQQYAFSLSTDDLVRSHHLHATVLSLLTLICYIHNAEVFYEYVHTIMERRAEWAPHLNPPLRAHYEYAQHHILWNKPELFFEDWEARYGLWKCFRVKKKYEEPKFEITS